MRRFPSLFLVAAAVVLTVSSFQLNDASALGGRCRRNCHPPASGGSGGGATQPPVVTKPVVTQPVVSQPSIPGPNLSSCGLFAKRPATQGYFSEIINGQKKIDAGLESRASKLFGSCVSQPKGNGSLINMRDLCCSGVKSVALKGCLDSVDQGSLENDKCAGRHGRQAQCCYSLKPQVLGVLHSYCAQRVSTLAKSCNLTDEVQAVQDVF